MQHVPFLIIGAGPTGLGAATRLTELGLDHLLVDAGPGPGGMAASRRDEQGFVWDLGGHVIHSHFREFDDAVRRSGVAVRDVVRNGRVWVRGSEPGSLVPAPLQAQLERMPEDLQPEAPAANLAEYYRNCFGQGLYDAFFEGYNVKMWGTPLERVDHSWTSLRSGGNGRNVPTLSLAKDFRPCVEAFPYPVGGTGALWEAIAETMTDRSVHRYGTSVTSVDLPAHVARLDDGSKVRYQHLISTAPLPWLLTSAGLADLASGLRASKEWAVGLGFSGAPPAALESVTWMYCPDPEVAFSRATVMSTYDPGAAGEGRWSILLEVPEAEGSRWDDEEAVRACLDALAVLGVDEADLLSTWTEPIPQAYPVPTLGRDEILRRADAVLVEHDVRSRGRFGGWRYESCNQDYSYVQGIQAVDAALTGSAEDVLWEPERY